VPNTEVLTLRLDSKLRKKLDKRAKATEGSRSFSPGRGDSGVCRPRWWQIEEIKNGLGEADAGDFATDEEVEIIRVLRSARRWPGKF
jgi:predicted transcriptional regulator